MEDIQARTKSRVYMDNIENIFDSNTQVTGDNVKLNGSDAPVKITGKVRDIYDLGDKLALVTTDRQSGFDRMLAQVPYKVSVSFRFTFNSVIQYYSATLSDYGVFNCVFLVTIHLAVRVKS